jgi:DNA invertase Pin-like site-specific DNA recombinase
MNEKIKPEHRQRAAYVYVRQSTAHQTRHHREGQQRQYDLAQRGRELGFAQVVVIDEDLGRSGSGLQERPGFGRLLTAVCQGAAGAVLALEASRLARNNRDWHQLIDWCALSATLIIDEDGVYDPKLVNDRLLLGLKGTMSEFELSLLRQRARQAYLQKVKRGHALWELPVGFVHGPEGRIEKTPDLQVQQALEMVFQKFAHLGSVRQTLIWLVEQKLLLPRVKPASQAREVIWEKASASRLRKILHNPCYAGAFAYGRTASRITVVEGRARRGASRQYRPLEEWEVLIVDHHPGYITWTEYLEHRERMAKNIAQAGSESSGAIKEGRALLSGLLRCGKCGRKLHVRYSGKGGRVSRYVCSGARDQAGWGGCLSIGGWSLEQAVVHQVLEALAPAGLEAAWEAGAQGVQEEAEKRRALELALERARYEAQRARRQYDAVEPENRLVAAELERRWNEALSQQQELEQRLSQESAPRPSEEMPDPRALLEWGAALPRLWNHPQSSVGLKKEILRTVIQEIVVQEVEATTEHRLQIHWAGGVHTELRLPWNRAGQHRRQADAQVIELVRELAQGCEDRQIAGVLNRLGYRTGQDHTWKEARVAQFRRTHQIAAFSGAKEWLTLEEAARQLQLSHPVVKRLIERGILPARQVVACAPWMIDPKDLHRPQVQAAARNVHAGRRVPPTLIGQPELPIK